MLKIFLPPPPNGLNYVLYTAVNNVLYFLHCLMSSFYMQNEHLIEYAIYRVAPPPKKKKKNGQPKWPKFDKNLLIQCE